MEEAIGKFGFGPAMRMLVSVAELVWMERDSSFIGVRRVSVSYLEGQGHETVIDYVDGGPPRRFIVNFFGSLSKEVGWFAADYVAGFVYLVLGLNPTAQQMRGKTGFRMFDFATENPFLSREAIVKTLRGREVGLMTVRTRGLADAIGNMGPWAVSEQANQPLERAEPRPIEPVAETPEHSPAEWRPRLIQIE